MTNSADEEIEKNSEKYGLLLTSIPVMQSLKPLKEPIKYCSA
jgi:hypothetical protein